VSNLATKRPQTIGGSIRRVELRERELARSANMGHTAGGQ
jgi:hypothetical protein